MAVTPYVADVMISRVEHMVCAGCTHDEAYLAVLPELDIDIMQSDLTEFSADEIMGMVQQGMDEKVIVALLNSGHYSVDIAVIAGTL